MTYCRVMQMREDVFCDARNTEYLVLSIRGTTQAVKVRDPPVKSVSNINIGSAHNWLWHSQSSLSANSWQVHHFVHRILTILRVTACRIIVAWHQPL